MKETGDEFFIDPDRPCLSCMNEEASHRITRMCNLHMHDYTFIQFKEYILIIPSGIE